MSDKTTKALQSYTLNKALFYYFLKKTERLTRAIYLVTNFFPEQEPLRWKLRESNLDLLEYLQTSVGATSEVDMSFIKRSLEMAVASLGVAQTAGLISEMNYAVLRSEYEALIRELEREMESDGSHSPLLFPGDFFDVERRLDKGSSSKRFLYSSAFEDAGTYEKTHREELLDALNREVAGKEKAGTALPSAEKGAVDKGQSENIKDIKDSKRTEVSRTPSPARTQDSTDRRDVILQLVKDKKEITVKDAAREIQDVSEKTLQREIVALVEEGVLERVGSRRWSRYRFV